MIPMTSDGFDPGISSCPKSTVHHRYTILFLQFNTHCHHLPVPWPSTLHPTYDPQLAAVMMVLLKVNFEVFATYQFDHEKQSQVLSLLFCDHYIHFKAIGKMASNSIKMNVLENSLVLLFLPRKKICESRMFIYIIHYNMS